MRKLSQVDVEARLAKLNLQILEPYVSKRTKHLFKNFNCNHVWTANAEMTLAGGKKCPYCNKKHTTRHQFNKALKHLGISVGEDYVNLSTKVEVNYSFCGHSVVRRPEGVFRIRGECPVCRGTMGVEGSKTERFIKQAREQYGDRFDYSEVNYNTSKDAVPITCDKGHRRLVKPNQHLSIGGCFDCKRENMVLTTAEWIQKSRLIHKGYDYSKSVYVDTNSPITIICPKGHEYDQRADAHIQGQGCPRCVVNVSKPEIELRDFISEYTTVEPNYRRIKGIRDVDIFLPELNIALEFNGLYWHNSASSIPARNRHKVKTYACNAQGIRLIHIFEDDWTHRKDIVKAMLMHIVCKNSIPIYARKLTTKLIDVKESNVFLKANHLLGEVRSSFRVGHYYLGDLVAVTTFIKRGTNWELNRHSVALGLSITGVLGKSIKFADITGDIISFCDLSLYEGKSYTSSGFVEVARLAPDYKYVRGTRRLHKFGFRHKALAKKLENYDPNLTEKQNTENHKIYQIYDCGKIKFVLPYTQ